MNSDGFVGGAGGSEEVEVGVGSAGEGGLNVNVGNGDTSFNLITIMPRDLFNWAQKML